jgi:hypothetical protein
VFETGFRVTRDWIHDLIYSRGFALTICWICASYRTVHASIITYYLSEQINVLLWWRQNAHLHRIVSRIASRELARPDENGLQERVFSFCKLLDSPLRRNLSDNKF